jgi:heat shock protein HslJ
MITEDTFRQMLEMVAKYKLEKETLTFYGSAKTPIATFVAIK